MRNDTCYRWLLLLLVLNVCCIRSTLPFQTTSNKCHHHLPGFISRVSSKATTTARSAKKPKDALEESVQKKLVSETLAPYRPLRLFLYGALGSGAFVGGLITVSAVAATWSGARADVDVNAEVSLCNFVYSYRCWCQSMGISVDFASLLHPCLTLL
jgi:hypothetical protein